MVNPPQNTMSAGLKIALDFAPLAAFFLGYRFGDLMLATALLVAATLVSLVIVYVMERKIALAPLVSGVFVAIMGGLTLVLDDPSFIKIKPTLVNLLFAAILLIGVYGFKRGLLRYLLDVAFTLTDRGWVTLSRNWGFFFVFLAALNEFIWRSFSTDFWVDFKVFGMFTLTISFALSQLYVVRSYTVSN